MFLPENVRIGAVLCDYLVIGCCYADKTARDKLLQRARDTEVILGRWRVVGGKIYYDGRNIGSIGAATGGASRWGWKIKFSFKGRAFRPLASGGAALNYHDCLWLVTAYELRATLPDELDDLYRRHAHVRQQIANVRVQLAEAEALAQTCTTPRAAEVVEELRESLRLWRPVEEQVTRQLDRARQTIGAVNGLSRAYTTVDRLDYAIECELPDDDPIAQLWSATPKQALPSRWAPRGQVTSRKSGTTVYLGTAHEPLAKRGERPLVRVYQYARPTYGSEPSSDGARDRREEEAERAKRLRVEVECPNVINVSPDRTLGIRSAGELAAQLLGPLLGLDVLPVREQQPGDRPGAYVPLLPMDPDGSPSGSLNPSAALDTRRPLLSHAGSELRRLARCGLGNLRNIARIQATAAANYSPEVARVDYAADNLDGSIRCPVSEELVTPALTLDEMDDLLELVVCWRALLHPGSPAPALESWTSSLVWEDHERSLAYRGRYLQVRSPGSADAVIEHC